MNQNIAHDILRTQLMLGMGNVNSGYKGLISIFALNMYDRLIATFPSWWPTVKAFCNRRQKYQSSTPAPPTNKEVRCTIECERILQSSNGKSTQQPTNTKMDAVVNYITTIPAVRNLLCMTHSDYLPNEFEPLQIEPDLYFQLISLDHRDGHVESFKFKLFCYEHEIQYLQLFVDKCNVDYERRMLNKLGTSLYFFDMMTESKNKRAMNNPLPTSHIMYTKHKFYTTRSFDNIFFEQKPKVSKHVQFFLTRKDWYEKKGIPYTLGFLFHGDPGCGKTSTIKAIANTARRHIINIQLSEIKSKAQLRHLFFNDEIHVFNGNTTEKYTIPVNERMYVIEDIDAMGDAVLRREWKKPVVEEKPKKATGDPWLDKEEEAKEPLDLSFLLNLLDGTLESAGRILAISSNFPERIDRALIRPGRIDMIVHFKKCNKEILQEMVDSFYDGSISGLETEEYKWSPAEVNQILFRNFDKPEEAVKELNELQPKDLYGFSSSDVGSYEQFSKTDTP